MERREQVLCISFILEVLDSTVSGFFVEFLSTFMQLVR